MLLLLINASPALHPSLSLSMSPALHPSCTAITLIYSQNIVDKYDPTGMDVVISGEMTPEEVKQDFTESWDHHEGVLNKMF